MISCIKSIFFFKRTPAILPKLDAPTPLSRLWFGRLPLSIRRLIDRLASLCQRVGRFLPGRCRGREGMARRRPT